jgi:MFS family permease
MAIESIPEGGGHAMPISDHGPARGAVHGLKGWVALFVILSSIGFNVLLVLAIMPVMSIIGTHFDSAPHDTLTIRIFDGLFGPGPHGALISQFLETMSGIGIMLGAPVNGWIAGRIGTRNLLLMALAIYGVAGSACGLVDNVDILLLLRLLQGFGSSGIAVSIYSLVSERYEGAERSRMIGYQGVSISAMGFISLPIAGIVADHGGWHAPFALYLLAFVMLILAWLSLPTNRPVRAVRHGRVEQGRAAGDSLAPLLPLYLLAIPLYLALNTTNLHVSFVLAGDGITKATGQSYVMLASSVLYLLGGLLYGRVFERLGQRWTLCLILGLMAGNGLVIGLSHAIWTMAIGVGLAGLSGGFMIPFLTNQVVNRAGPAARSRAIGFLYMATYIGNFLNPPIVTPLRQYFGNHQLFLGLGVILAAATVAQAVSRRSPLAEPA